MEDIRIIPLILEFKDVSAGDILKLKVAVRNAGTHGKEIRLFPPKSKCFDMKVQNLQTAIAPGLEVVAKIKYIAENEAEKSDRLIAVIDGVTVEIPIKAFPKRPILEIDGVLDFGTVVASCKMEIREFFIYNRGSKEGEFSFSYCGDQAIKFDPAAGKVPPKSTLCIRVEFTPERVAQFNDGISVDLEGREKITLCLRGNVVHGSLHLLNYESNQPLKCVQFGATYYGTDTTQSGILFNNSPLPICFVVVLDNEAIGQEMGDKMSTGEVNPFTSMVTAIPNQGLLQPYENAPIFFRFSPRWSYNNQGFKTTRKAPPCRDFAMFLKVVVVGSLPEKCISSEESQGIVLDLALTGTALPVELKIIPEPSLEFGQCMIGQHVNVPCTLVNHSPMLPVTFQFQRLAHFTPKPLRGQIEPGKHKEVVFTFSPNQVGDFRFNQVLDFLGQVADHFNFFVSHLEVIHTISIDISGRSDKSTTYKEPVFNPGITPKITNEVGLYVDTKFSQVSTLPRAAKVNAHRSKSLKNRNNNQSMLVAVPNDRQQSIGPFNRDEKYETIFTGLTRYNYIDPDYAYDDDQTDAVQKHKQYYVAFIEELRQNRINKLMSSEYHKFNNEKDIAMRPAAGIKPRKLQVSEINEMIRVPTPPNAAFKLLNTKELKENERQSEKQVMDGLNAIPTTAQEKVDCHKMLTPAQLHQVTISPVVINFGEVCPKSVSQKNISVVNNLDQFIHFSATVDCKELRQTSPLSQVIPPRSKAVLPLIFESAMKGRFQRMLEYTINGFYKNSIMVFADVVALRLELSTERLQIEQQFGLPPDTALRGNVTLYNKLNYPTQFTWNPILSETGTAFSIRPASGTVEAFSDLHCEVVYHPSCVAPGQSDFDLQVHGGSHLKLCCVAKFGVPNVQLVDRRVIFGQVPIQLTTTKIAMLKNTSTSHSYFQILDSNPFPGLLLSPVFGSVPAGGTSVIHVKLSPESVIKFDTKVNIRVRNTKDIELRVCGTVEPPSVDIDLDKFDFNGVYCGSKSSVPFLLKNKAGTKAKIEFDLTQCRDFSLDFVDKHTSDDELFEILNPGMFSITMNEKTEINCQLIFTPTEVASYNFVMPVTVNASYVPTPSPTPLPPPPHPCTNHIITPRPLHVDIITPKKRVVATAQRSPIQVSHRLLKFTMFASALDSDLEAGICETLLLVNVSKLDLCWSLELTCAIQALEEGVFKLLRKDGTPYWTQGSGKICGCLESCLSEPISIMFSPGCSKEKLRCFEAAIPVILNDDFRRPYCHVTLLGEVKIPTLTFDPPSIVLSAVPLDIEVSAEFDIIADNYTENTNLLAVLPEVECEDGSKVLPLIVTFLDCNAPITEIKSTVERGSTVSCSQIIRCRVTFRCCKPISFCEDIKFTDAFCNSFPFSVTATGDNCLLSCYPFMAQHRSDHKIVCEQGKSLKGRCNISRESSELGEAMLLPCNCPGAASSRPPSTATSSIFDIKSSSAYDTSYESTSGTGDLAYESTPREGALNKFNTDSIDELANRADPILKTFGSVLFPEDDTDEGVFYIELLGSLQRWFTSHGWPSGITPVVIPESFRGAICKKPNPESAKSADGSTWESPTLEREMKTIYEMLSHLSGKPLPGFNPSNPFPLDPTERVRQIYRQHTYLLAFLRNQGGCVAAIKPEYLMEMKDYKHWKRLKRIEHCNERSKKENLDVKAREDVEEMERIDGIVFEAISRKSWMDLCLQLFKTLILAKITPRQFKNVATPYKNAVLPVVDVNPLCSNVYSMSERIVLLWLNYHYERQKDVVWKNCTKGSSPPSRWVVNFDFDILDGLVLAAVLGAYVPFLIPLHLQEMYTRPASAEQCLHNAVCVVNAIRTIGIDYDIQAIDITDPNSISMLLLCTFLYFTLPQYIPRSSVEFVAGLHDVSSRQVKLSNPSSKPLVYRAMLAGPDARDFCLPKCDVITIAPKASMNVTVNYRSRFMRSSEGVLVLMGRRHGSTVGSTLVFDLRTRIDNITPKETVEMSTPCYQECRIPINVQNPFSENAKFRIILVETEYKGIEKCGTKLKSKKKTGKTGIPSHCLKETENDEDSGHLVSRNANSKYCSGKDEICSFFCRDDVVSIPACGSKLIELSFLPLTMGKRQCTVIFTDDNLGEFLYLIVATTLLPLPETVPFVECSATVRISSASATADGEFGPKNNFEDPVVYWKCEVGKTLEHILPIPIKNAPKEEALIKLSKLLMSDVELRQRELAGFFSKGSLSSKSIRTLSSNLRNLGNLSAENCNEELEYTVELNSINFSAPPTFLFTKEQGSRSCKELATDCNRVVELPVTFASCEPGRYPCQVLLRNEDDIRVFHISCISVPRGNTAEIEFKSPVNECIVQNIPIINQTKLEWPMVIAIEGIGFSGPPTFEAIADCITQYPLQFIPRFEGIVQGKLVLKNTLDEVESTFLLQGEGQRPRALETLTLRVKVKQCVSQVLTIPNVTGKKLRFSVESDLNFLTGPDTITVLPGRIGHYDLTIRPLRRGHFKGVLTFVAVDNVQREFDSDGDEMEELSDTIDHTLKGYRLWYDVNITAEPGEPIKSLDVTCPCLEKLGIEVGVNNPTQCDINFEVHLIGHGLSGPSEFALPAAKKGTYEVTFGPSVVGFYPGSLVMYHDLVGEFWYQLNLVAQRPTPVTLGPMDCELGRWARQDITLNNPTDEHLYLYPTISNPNNFTIECSDERPIILQPHSFLNIPLTFMPSRLGTNEQTTDVAFHSTLLGEWVFMASGCGHQPQLQDPVSVSAAAGSNTTVIIPFRNPTDVHVRINVRMTDRNKRWCHPDDQTSQESPFCLLLKKQFAIPLGPKCTLQIPISFAPCAMCKTEADCEIVARREDAMDWEQGTCQKSNCAYSLENEKPIPRLPEIRWIYPLHGFAEISPPKNCPPALFECKARQRIQERLEVLLTGCASSSAGPKRLLKCRAITPDVPPNADPNHPDGVVIGETIAVTEEFSYDLLYGNDEIQESVEPAVAIQLIRKERDNDSGLVVLVFNVIYAPYKIMKHTIELVVVGANGGKWKFPLRFVASEPEPDDVITIEAAGLHKTSTVAFRLTSQEDMALPFTASFVGGSDLEFGVHPQNGELPPKDDPGMLLTVTFKPGIYGKKYNAKLLVQTATMNWTYEIRGVLPIYNPPRGSSSKPPVGGPHPDPRMRGERINYLTENLKLATTAVSSPFKGAPLVRQNFC